MATTDRVKTVLTVFGAIALSVLIVAIFALSVISYHSSESRCGGYASTKAHVTFKCLEARACTVSPMDIADALQTSKDYPQCFRKQPEVTHEQAPKTQAAR